MSIRLLLIAVLLVVAGCAATPGKAVPANDTSSNDTPADTMPADFAGEVSYGNGSVAPPYHYEWRVEFDTRTARLSWSPGYDGTETWTEAVDLDTGTRETLYDRLHRAGLFEFPDEPDDGLVGGPTGHATFGDLYDGALGASEAGQDMLDEVVAATEDVFPDQVWAAMEQRQRDWEARQPK